jgi:hypothetical protein
MGIGRKHTPEQVVSLFRQTEVARSNGNSNPADCQKAGITEQTFYCYFPPRS